VASGARSRTQNPTIEATVESHPSKNEGWATRLWFYTEPLWGALNIRRAVTYIGIDTITENASMNGA